MKVYGPYLRPDGRSHVILYEDGKRTTQSYPRYLMEQHLGRKLESWEHVDHINENVGDNRIDNFRLVTLGENIQNSRYRLHQQQLMTFTCLQCSIEFTLEARQYRGNQLSKGKAGPFCSRVCAGRYSTGSTGTTYHGTNSGYTNRKCRCEECTRAHREYKQNH